ncbi:hypothetical protein [Flavobacterium sp.]|uniref:hypothetical protein n=1 Tax=Flavobacterium sp. TaxID=239 RepID=UPI00286D9F4B|nr:hypothetical protein [Flavobacterium sp.]
MKKFLLVLFLSVGATTFASTGKVATKIVKVKTTSEVVAKPVYYRTSCGGVDFGFWAGSASQAVAIASGFCAGGVISH